MRKHTTTPVSDFQFGEYYRLRHLVRQIAERAHRHTAGAAIDGFEAGQARRVMADLARFVAREPDGRSLLRLPAGGPIPQAVLLAACADCKVALAAFFDAHCDPGEPEELWLE